MTKMLINTLIHEHEQQQKKKKHIFYWLSLIYIKFYLNLI